MLFLLLVGVFQTAQAAAGVVAQGEDPADREPTILVDGRPEYRLEHFLEMYREPAAVFTVEDVISGAARNQFKGVDSATVALGQTSDAVWFRAKLKNVSDQWQDVSWAIRYIFIERLDIYRIEDGNVVDHLQMGKDFPYSARRVDMAPYVYPLGLAPDEQAEIIWRVKSGVPMLLPFYLLDRDRLARMDRDYSVYLGVFFGLMSGLVLYNLFLFFGVRDRSYLYYVCFVVFCTLLQLALMGALDKYTPSAVLLNRINGNLSSSLTVMFAILFAMRILNANNFPSWVQRTANGLAVFFFLCAIGSVLNLKNIHIVLTLSGSVVSTLVCVLAVYNISKKHFGNYYFLIAMVVWTLGVGVSTFLYMGLVPYTDFTVWTLPIVSVVLATLLSFTLAAQINDLRKQQVQSLLAAREAQTESRAKSQFLAQMSHEIRTPMNGVIGMADLLRQTKLDVQQKQYLDIIVNSGRTLLTIINDILDFSKIAAGKMDLEIRPIDFKQIVRECIQLFTLPAEEKAIYLKKDWKEGASPIIYGDSTRLRQVLTNLLSNALKFTEKGGITLRVKPCLRDSEPYLQVEVEDTGIGISVENQQRLFSAFSQAEASTTRRFGGTGLGLAISKQLVELMGGEIGVRSEEGVGSIFWFTLRAQPGEALAVSQSGAVSQAGAALKSNADVALQEENPQGAQQLHEPLPERYVLVAEDNLVNQKVIGVMLKKLGMRFDIAENGKEAVLKYMEANSPYDLVFMDCEMPEMDGYQAAKEIRSYEHAKGMAAVPVVALSAHVMDEHLQAVKDSGMNDALAKPLTLDTLECTLRRYLASRNS
ncbi:Putative two-component sensor histdine kinase [gamma proteobacterium HdN1]|nr:Putative two-component sensor histdine kinase [gamma proteobacterium HdN1]